MLTNKICDYCVAFSAFCTHHFSEITVFFLLFLFSYSIFIISFSATIQLFFFSLSLLLFSVLPIVFPPFFLFLLLSIPGRYGTHNVQKLVALLLFLSYKKHTRHTKIHISFPPACLFLSLYPIPRVIIFSSPPHPHTPHAKNSSFPSPCVPSHFIFSTPFLFLRWLLAHKFCVF
jgi:hypothetical protein